MEKNLENRLSMYYKIREYFTNNLTTLNTIAPGLTAVVSTFNTKVGELQNLVTIADQDNSGVTTQKQNNRTALRDQALSISGALYAFAKLNNNETLASKVYVTKSDLDGKRDTDMLFWCNRLKTLANVPANTTGIAPLGITAAKLTAYASALTAFDDFIQEPADKRGEGVAAGKEATMKVEEIDKVLDILDNLMLVFRSSNSFLFNQYNADRLIDDNAATGSSTPDVTEIVEANTFESIYNVPYLASRKFKINNTGNDIIEWGLSDDANTATFPLNSLAGQTSSNKLSSSIAPSGDFLIIHNPSTNDITVELSIEE